MNQPETDLNQLAKMAKMNRQVINRLKDRVSVLENALELVCDDPMMLWLYRNRSERMDALVALFPKARSEFHLARYQFAAERVAEKTVADIACGTGYGTRVLVEQGNARQVTGVDLCDEAIRYAQTRHQVAASTFLCADGTQTGLDNESFDCVVSFETIEHVPDDLALLDEFARILKPGGTLICSTPNGWPLEIAPHHVRVYDRRSFVERLGNHFEVHELFNQNSGSDFKYNHGQPAGITKTTDSNHEQAECFIAVATKK